MDYRLPKRERVSKRSDIERLFRTGEAFLVYPVKCTYLKRDISAEGEGSTPDYHRVLVMAPKRNLKRAVDRNRMKRRLREAYRLNKSQLTATDGDTATVYYDIALSYIAKGGVLLDYQIIETAVRKILKRLWELENETNG